MPTISRSQFDALVQRAGLDLPPSTVAELFEAWAFVQPMLDRVRATERGLGIEPAQIFVVDAWANAASGKEDQPEC